MSKTLTKQALDQFKVEIVHLLAGDVRCQLSDHDLKVVVSASKLFQRCGCVTRTQAEYVSLIFQQVNGEYEFENAVAKASEWPDP